MKEVQTFKHWAEKLKLINIRFYSGRATHVADFFRIDKTIIIKIMFVNLVIQEHKFLSYDKFGRKC